MTIPPSWPISSEPQASRSSPLSRPEPIAGLPVIVLMVHKRCNCRCVMCHLWRDASGPELPLAAVAGWLAEWRTLGVQWVLITGGEPLLYRPLRPLLALFADAGLRITLLTNGVGLSAAAPWLARYCDEIVVSVDGPQPIHNQIRGLPRVYEQIAAGVAAIKKVGIPVAISGRCTVQRLNYQYLGATVRAARELGLDRISFLAADVSSQAFDFSPESDHPGREEVVLTPEDLPRLAREIDSLEHECAAAFQQGYIAETPAKLHRRIWHYFAALLGQGEFIPPACNAPWVSAVIEPDGSVRPCFFHRPLGNLYEQGSLEALLNAPASLAWRRLLKHESHDLCRRCVCSLWLKSSRGEGASVAAGKTGSFRS